MAPQSIPFNQILAFVSPSIDGWEGKGLLLRHFKKSESSRHVFRFILKLTRITRE